MTSSCEPRVVDDLNNSRSSAQVSIFYEQLSAKDNMNDTKL